MKLEYRNIDDLTIHPAVKSQPRLSEDELLEWRKGFKAAGEGNMPPIYITPDGQIVDGRHRYWCAKKLGWKTVPVIVVPDDQVYSIILESLANRRHYTKSQLAYIVVPMLDDVFNEAKKRMLATQNNEAGKAASHSLQSCAETPESVAARLGVSYRVLMQAKEIRELFKADKVKRTMTDRDEVTEKDVTLEEFFEPRILLAEDPEAPRTRAYGLGAVLAGCHAVIKMEGMAANGRVHDGGRPAKVEQQLSLFDDSLKSFSTKFAYWEKWNQETRQAAMAALPPVVEKMPPDLQVELARLLKIELKRHEK